MIVEAREQVGAEAAAETGGLDPVVTMRFERPSPDWQVEDRQVAHLDGGSFRTHILARHDDDLARPDMIAGGGIVIHRDD